MLSRTLRLSGLLPTALVAASILPATAETLSTTTTAAASRPLPLLVWHGLGDRYDADGMQSIGELAESINPGTFVYFVRTSEDSDQDRKDTFFGDLNVQIDEVCNTLQTVPELRDPVTGSIRVDALGFSQGGQFLRGLLQRCEPLSVRTLMTYGSQHNGIASLRAAPCSAWDFVCKGAAALLKGNVWTPYVQTHVIPAQYFRTVDEETGLPTEEYLDRSNFLADINNEREQNARYASRIAALEKFVMVLFADDTTVIPKESGWFAEVNSTSGEVTPLRQREIYKQDWLGLKKLDKKDGLVFLTTPGDHMKLDEGVLRVTFAMFYGPERGSRGLAVEAEQAEKEIQALLDFYVAQGETPRPMVDLSVGATAPSKWNRVHEWL